MQFTGIYRWAKSARAESLEIKNLDISRVSNQEKNGGRTGMKSKEDKEVKVSLKGLTVVILLESMNE